MKTIHKSYKFRLYPTKEQEVLLRRHCGSCRFVYNHFLNLRKTEYLNNEKTLNYYDCASLLTVLKKQDEYKWLNEINSQSLQQSLRHLDAAYGKFFNKQEKFPRFHKRTNGGSFTVPQSFKIEGNMVKLPKFKQPLKLKCHRKLEGKQLFCTVSMTPTGKFYLSVTCEVQHRPHKKTKKKVGIDTGIKDLAILSTGKKYENPKLLKRQLKRLKYEQKQLSKKQKGSSNRTRQRLVVARLHEKITNQRADYLHKVTTDIVKNHDLIAVESLVVKNLMKNHCLAQSFSDVALGKFYTLLKYKSEWNNRTYIEIDRFFPSSKTCHRCGWINQELTLKDREWTCSGCQVHHDRDDNASKMILKQGINQCEAGTVSALKTKTTRGVLAGEVCEGGSLRF